MNNKTQTRFYKSSDKDGAFLDLQEFVDDNAEVIELPEEYWEQGDNGEWIANIPRSKFPDIKNETTHNN